MNDLYRYEGRSGSERAAGSVPMWAVHCLPGGQEIEVDIAELVGVPGFAKRAILDADVQRRRAFTSKRSGEIGTALLRRLAQATPPGRHPNTDPLLWLLRVRWFVRSAALSLPDLQLVAQPPDVWSFSYRSMAPWACRVSRVQPRNRELCLRLLNEGRWGESVSDYETCHWFLWAAASHGCTREEAWDLARCASFFGPREANVSNGCVDTPNVSDPLQAGWRFPDGEAYDPERAAPGSYPPAWRFVGTRLDLVGSDGRTHPANGGDV